MRRRRKVPWKVRSALLVRRNLSRREVLLKQQNLNGPYHFFSEGNHISKAGFFKIWLYTFLPNNSLLLFLHKKKKILSQCQEEFSRSENTFCECAPFTLIWLPWKKFLRWKLSPVLPCWSLHWTDAVGVPAQFRITSATFITIYKMGNNSRRWVQPALRLLLANLETLSSDARHHDWVIFNRAFLTNSLRLHFVWVTCNYCNRFTKIILITILSSSWNLKRD